MKKLMLIIGVFLSLATDNLYAKTKETPIYPCVFVYGKLKTPELQGYHSVRVYSENLPTSKYDHLTGTFDGNHVSDAQINFYGRWSFLGNFTLNVEVLENKTIVQYNLEKGVLKGHDNSFDIEKYGIKTIRRICDYGNSKFYVEDINFKIEGDSIFPENEITSFLKSRKYHYVRPYTLKDLVGYDHTECGTFVFEDSTKLVVEPDYVCLSFPPSDTIVYSTSKKRFMKIVYTYPEATVLYVLGEEGKIQYTNGEEYTGTFDIGGMYGGPMSFQDGMEAIRKQSLNEVQITYQDGTLKRADGSEQIWKDNFTEIQRKTAIAAKTKVAAEVAKLNAKEKQAKLAECAKAWANARPTLEARYGKQMIADLYNYRITIGMPLQLFRDLNQLGLPLVDFSGTVSDANDVWERKTTLITLFNRQTGEIAFQRYLHFNTSDRVQKIDSNL